MSTITTLTTVSLDASLEAICQIFPYLDAGLSSLQLVDVLGPHMVSYPISDLRLISELSGVSGVYQVTILATGATYIGCANDLLVRLSSYTFPTRIVTEKYSPIVYALQQAGCYLPSSSPLHMSINAVISVVVLFTCHALVRRIQEAFMISAAQPDLNQEHDKDHLLDTPVLEGFLYSHVIGFISRLSIGIMQMTIPGVRVTAHYVNRSLAADNGYVTLAHNLMTGICYVFLSMSSCATALGIMRPRIRKNGTYYPVGNGDLIRRSSDEGARVVSKEPNFQGTYEVLCLTPFMVARMMKSGIDVRSVYKMADQVIEASKSSDASKSTKRTSKRTVKRTAKAEPKDNTTLNS